MRVKLALRFKRGKEAKQPAVHSVDLAFQGGTAYAWRQDDGQRFELERARISFIAKDGMLLEGTERSGATFHLQQWWCVPEPEGGQ